MCMYRVYVQCTSSVLYCVVVVLLNTRTTNVFSIATLLVNCVAIPEHCKHKCVSYKLIVCEHVPFVIAMRVLYRVLQVHG
jgi:hypothetical protein